ncbi:Zinc finger, PHD-type [Corchorus olitorius]|uniref:Zinc finger, PHD-type n=1 Tax=Corchorus olitorius TaxID=93759 RepID=A0A1R3K6T5_9ROSI|nr:Zinc finger, PHD-type [Corchorus olitorius]
MGSGRDSKTGLDILKPSRRGKKRKRKRRTPKEIHSSGFNSFSFSSGPSVRKEEAIFVTERVRQIIVSVTNNDLSRIVIMKGRTHRADPHDDWGDGSWTVDCICGVTFDDGEEMVKCDECGVWVHTRCSRYTKSEELFACDKCKNKSNRNDSEETEVAQLLVELPTKTVRIESSYVSHVPPRRPFRLWTDIPMEERVHVQGIPGGEPGLFEGLSGVFTPELWKCTGYVPKKFNFQYREFPCWDENKEGGNRNDKQNENDNENGNLVDNGAGVLVSLSKERVFGAPMYPMKDNLKGGKKSEGEDTDGRRWQNGARKDRTVLHPVVITSNKRKKDELRASKDRSAKKKSRSAAEKEAHEKKRGAQSHKTVFRTGSDAKQLEFYEDRGSKSIKTDIQSVKNKNSKDGVLQDPTLDGNFALNHTIERPKNSFVGKERALDASTSGMSGHDGLIRSELKEEKADHHFPPSMESSPKTEDVALLLELKDPGITPVKIEGDSVATDKVDNGVEGSSRSPKEHMVVNLASSASGVQSIRVPKESNGSMSHSSVKPAVEVKREMNDDDGMRVVLTAQLSPHADAKDTGTSVHQTSETSQINVVVGGSAQPSNCKTKAVESGLVADCHSSKAKEMAGDCSVVKHDSSEVSESVQKTSSESKHVPASAEETKPSGNVATSEEQPIQHKTVVCVGKSPSTSSVAGTMSIPDNSKFTDTQNSIASTKLRVIAENNASIKKDHAASDVPRDEDRNDLSRKTAKERPKSSFGSTSKVPHHSRITHSSISKRTLADTKDSVPSSSSKASSVQNASVTSVSCESGGSLQSQSASHVQQNKTSALGCPQKGEKFNQSSTQPASKVTTLSDEELALLLHQELNSSPRVPRVPRVRHTGSFPQLASPTATSMLIKRTSSSGGKEHSMVSRRKNKDASKDGSRGSREFDDEAKRSDKGLSSPDQRQDIGSVMHASAKRDDKSVPPAPTTTTNSGPSSSTEANDQNLSSIRSSPRNISDDDMGTLRGSVPRTLPGLINEIMSKGRRMTYEELCNAVLPHWPNLRKHNGERYAYSSHSQAVLDCLRNRQEWAQLVDRGPKTNSSRKRRKADAEESEDNEYSKGRNTKEVESKSMESQKEEFPKGKRKARKRRRLALQGRGIKDVQRRRKADLTDDDAGAFSNSSEESMFSEDEIQGGGGCPAGSEASASSD